MNSDLNSLSMSLTGFSPESTGEPPKKLAEAAKQFEAMMITQMMKSTRESSGSGWLNDGDETGEDTSMGMAEEQFAQSLASNGGLGLAKMVIKTMTHAASKSDLPPGGPQS